MFCIVGNFTGSVGTEASDSVGPIILSCAGDKPTCCSSGGDSTDGSCTGDKPTDCSSGGDSTCSSSCVGDKPTCSSSCAGDKPTCSSSCVGDKPTCSSGDDSNCCSSCVGDDSTCCSSCVGDKPTCSSSCAGDDSNCCSSCVGDKPTCCSSCVGDKPTCCSSCVGDKPTCSSSCVGVSGVFSLDTESSFDLIVNGIKDLILDKSDGFSSTDASFDSSGVLAVSSLGDDSTGDSTPSLPGTEDKSVPNDSSSLFSEIDAELESFDIDSIGLTILLTSFSGLTISSCSKLDVLSVDIDDPESLLLPPFKSDELYFSSVSAS